jgi:hypothetical protein
MTAKGFSPLRSRGAYSGLLEVIWKSRWALDDPSSGLFQGLLSSHSCGPATLYYITPLRRWINSPHHNRITENIRLELIKIGEYSDNADKFTWQFLRSLFFSLVDNDESLKK